MREDIWNAMLTADMNARYWATLSRRCIRRDKWSKIFLAIMSSGTVASWGLWGQLTMLWQTLSGASAVVAVALPIIGMHETISKTSEVHGKWVQLWQSYEKIWRDFNAGRRQEAERDFNQLRDRAVEAQTMEASLCHNKALLKDCQEEVMRSRGITNFDSPRRKSDV